ncbi:MAG TPA: hypothetical protein VJZ51_03060 [Bacilli bacterium]|nr:hypothetical protein [Bacilli bacterium]
MRLPAKIKEILHIFEKENIDVYVVGGALRDILLGRKPSDFDLATPAVPEKVQELFKSYRLVLTGVKHGTVGVLYKNIYVEITTFRKEEDYIDHRHPTKIDFIDDLKSDLSRRDFTINALAYNNQLYDYFGGINDLNNKIIKTVGNPYQRFEEDGLRVLRALRFSSMLDFPIDNETEKAIHEKKDLILSASYERINAEFSKLLIGSGVDNVIKNYFSIIGVFIPRLIEIAFNDDMAEKIARLVAKTEALLVPRLAALYYLLVQNDYDFVFEDLQRLKYSKKISYQVKDILFITSLLENIDDIKIKKILKAYDESAIITAVTIKETADNMDFSYLKERIHINSSECYNLKKMHLKGDDLLTLGIKNKRNIKEILEYLLNEIIEGRLINDKDVLITKAKEIKRKKEN